MSKMKKLLAMLLTLAMVLGMSMTTMAADVTVPSAENTAQAEVTGVESGATVRAYQIVKGDYNSNGLYGYSVANDRVEVTNIVEPSYDDVMKIAQDINAGNVFVDESGEENGKDYRLNSVPMVYNDGKYVADLTTGQWIILVRGTGSSIYNPMRIGVYYELKNGDNSLTAGSVNAENDEWELIADKTVAKKSTIDIKKEADRNTQDTDENVNFIVETVVPDYSNEYTKVLFQVKDTLTNLTLNKGTVKVYAATKEQVQNAANKEELLIDATNYTLTTAEKSLKVDFKENWVKINGNQAITITYTATLDEDAVNVIPGKNKVELYYTNNPGEDKGYDKDEEKIYSFVLDVFKKVDEKNEALPNAQFSLFTDEACKTPYSNGQFDNPVISNSEGRMEIKGLDVGTYYLKETKAPAGYTLNTTIYKVVVSADIETDDELKLWTVEVTPIVDGVEGDASTNTYTVVNGEAEEGEEPVVSFNRSGEDVNIANTKLVELPSTGGIGTTIFTVAGCGIMIAAAYLFFNSRRREEA